MVLSEILSTSFLFSIAIVIILVGGLFAYFNHRLGAQNHKISSMMGLVSTMAEEMQYFRSKLSGRVVQEKEKEKEQCKMPDADLIHIVPQFMGGSKDELIEVSDGEDDDLSDDSEESDDDLSEADLSEADLSEADLSEESDDDDSDSDSESDEDEETHIKSINIDLANEIDLNIDDEIDPEDSITISEDNTKTINLSEDISSFEITSKTLENINDIDISIKLTNDYSEKDETNKVDYKKMSLNKLREVVIEKALVVDASKLKKNDILKMLGAEQ